MPAVLQQVRQCLTTPDILRYSRVIVDAATVPRTCGAMQPGTRPTGTRPTQRDASGSDAVQHTGITDARPLTVSITVSNCIIL